MLQSHFARIIRPAALAVTAVLALATGTAAAATTVLSYSPWLPPEHELNHNVIYPWMKKVAEVTEGRVRVESRAATVGSPREQFEVVRDGLADVSIIPLGYTPGRFPLVELGELPLLHEDDAVLAPAFYRIYLKHLASFEPFKGTHLLSVYPTTPTDVVTSKGIIDDIGKFKGLKLRVPNSTTSEMAKAVGAIPLQKSATEEYQLASTGIIDGTFAAPHTIVNFGTGQFLRYMTEVPGGLGQAVQVLLVNERKWKSISEQDRAAIMSISGEAFARAAGKSFADSRAVAAAKLQKDGVVIKRMPPAAVARLADKFKAVDAAWMKSARRAGLKNPELVLADFRAELKAEAKAQGKD